MNFKNNKSGITLLSLIITIIILLILAGISISTLTQTGLFKKAKQATESYKETEEKERIQTELYSSKIEISTNDNIATTIGKKLYDKNVENG